MPNLNRVMLIGHLTRDIETRAAGSSTVGNVGIAVSRKWKDASGAEKEETAFIDCEAWGKTAEILAQYVGKGDPLYVEGRLRLDQWEDKDGGKRSKLKVVIEGFQFLRSKDKSERPERPAARSSRPQQQHRDMNDSEVPF